MFNIGSKENLEIDEKGISNLRGLAIDMIQEANSGHPGVCLGAAGILYTLFKKHLNIDLNNLDFVNRDRFILSAGHAVPLLYSLDYFLGLLTLEDLKDLRKLDSMTPGHPEYSRTPLVECTTGPLGQGIAAGVGMAISECYLREITNEVINHYTYVFCGDGELQEGITYEALSLAGTLNLNRLIILCDKNDTTLDSDIANSSNEDLKKRFESINFEVIEAEDNIESIDEALIKAKNSNMPSIIFFKTTIGLYSPYAGTNTAHSKVLTEEEIQNIKEKLDLYQTKFTINQEVIDDFQNEVNKRGIEKVNEFQEKYNNSKNKELIDKLVQKDATYILNDIDLNLENKSLRDLSSDILNYISQNFSLVIGGSADLSSSCKTNLVKEEIFNSKNYRGRNIYFGIREHAMAGIMNGMALSGIRPFGSTFLTFSDYMRPAIRMSALMNIPVLYIFTHDSITVGKDGPTHQPIEQLASLELIPNLKIYRPYDLNELIGCYKEIYENNQPSVLILPRDNQEISENTKSSGIKEGIYVVLENETDNYINLLSQGEELGITIQLARNLKEIGIDTKVYSLPCLKNISNYDYLFNNKTIAITLTNPEYFYKFTQNVIGINTFGSSGSKEELLEKFGFSLKELESKIMEILKS